MSPEPLDAVCIGRHRYLSEHVCQIFTEIGVDCLAAVGFDEGVQLARERQPQLAICDYDLLVNAPLEEWEHDPTLSAIPLIAVSLSRRPNEGLALDANGIAGFLYLPTVSTDALERVIQAAIGSRPANRRADGVIRPPHDALRRIVERRSALHLD